MAGPLAGKHVEEGAYLSSMVNVVLVNTEQDHRNLAPNVKLRI